MNNDITELRALLFDTIRDVRDLTKPMDLVRAQRVAELGQVLINSVTAETKFIQATANLKPVTGRKSVGSGFIEAPQPTLDGGTDAE